MKNLFLSFAILFSLYCQAGSTVPPGSINTSKLADSAVTAAKLATDAVETAKIKDANVTAAKLASDSVSTAKIVDANVTTAKILDANITQAKMAARATGTTVAAGGVALSASCGTYTNVSTGYLDVTNLTVTITTTGRPVFIGLISDGSGQESTGLSAPNASNFAYFKILRGASVVGNYAFGFGAAFYSSPGAEIKTIDFPAAGTYTYKLQARVTGSTLGVNYMKMIAYEL